MNANFLRTRTPVALWAMILVVMPEIGCAWTPNNPQKSWTPFAQQPRQKQPDNLKELIPLGESKAGNEPDVTILKRDWDHYSISGGDPHFLFSEEHYERRNKVDTETVVEIAVPFLSPLVAFLSYDSVASTFHAGIDFVAQNNWKAVDGGAYQAMIITPTINGIVLPAIAVLFATLTAMTIRTLRDRQIDIRSCINAEAGELRAFEYIISAYPSGSELQAMTRQYLLQYTSRIIAESQPRYRHPLMEKNLPSTEHGMDSELNGVLGLLARTDVLPTLLQDQSFQAVCRLRLSRQNRLTALQSTYPTLHYGILAILASGEMTGFLIEGNQELLVFLNAVQLKILWSMLVGTFTSCFMVFYDLLNPFSGCYQVTAAVDQLQTIRLGLKAQTQLSLLDYDAIKRPLPVVNGEAEVPSKATPTPKVENTTEGKESVHAVAQKVNGSSAQASIPVEEKSPEKVNESAAQKPIPVDDKVPEKINGSTAQTPLLVEGDAAENVNGSAARKDFPVEEKVPDEVNGSTASKPLLVEGKAAEKINGAAVRKPFPADGKVPEKANGSTAPKPLLVEGKAAEKANGSAVRKPFLVDENVPEKVNGSSASTKPLFVEGKAAEKVNGSAVRKDFPLEGKIPEKVNGSTAPKPLLVEGKAAEKLNGSTAPNPLPVDDKVPEKVKEASIQKPRYYF